MMHLNSEFRSILFFSRFDHFLNCLLGSLDSSPESRTIGKTLIIPKPVTGADYFLEVKERLNETHGQGLP